MKCIVLLFVIGLASYAQAADIVDGWSSNSTIDKLYSERTRTLFKLSGVNNGCGAQDMWQLSLVESPSNGNPDARLSILLAAFIAGKEVKLRCENSTITDSEILN